MTHLLKVEIIISIYLGLKGLKEMGRCNKDWRQLVKAIKKSMHLIFILPPQTRSKSQRGRHTM